MLVLYIGEVIFSLVAGSNVQFDRNRYGNWPFEGIRKVASLNVSKERSHS